MYVRRAKEGSQEEFQMLKELLVWGGMYFVTPIVAECESRLWKFVAADTVCTLLMIANHHG